MTTELRPNRVGANDSGRGVWLQQQQEQQQLQEQDQQQQSQQQQPAAASTAGTIGYIFGFGGVLSGWLMLLITVIAAAGLLPIIPAGSTVYDWGLIYHAVHWGAWVLCLWPTALRRSGGFLLWTLLIHGVALLADATAFLLVLLGLLVNGLDTAALSLWAGLVAGVLLVLTAATTAALWTLHVDKHRQSR